MALRATKQSELWKFLKFDFLQNESKLEVPFRSVTKRKNIWKSTFLLYTPV